MSAHTPRAAPETPAPRAAFARHAPARSALPASVPLAGARPTRGAGIRRPYPGHHARARRERPRAVHPQPIPRHTARQTQDAPPPGPRERRRQQAARRPARARRRDVTGAARPVGPRSRSGARKPVDVPRRTGPRPSGHRRLPRHAGARSPQAPPHDAAGSRARAPPRPVQVAHTQHPVVPVESAHCDPPHLRPTRGPDRREQPSAGSTPTSRPPRAPEGRTDSRPSLRGRTGTAPHPRVPRVSPGPARRFPPHSADRSATRYSPAALPTPPAGTRRRSPDHAASRSRAAPEENPRGAPGRPETALMPHRATAHRRRAEPVEHAPPSPTQASTGRATPNPRRRGRCVPVGRPRILAQRAAQRRPKSPRRLPEPLAKVAPGLPRTTIPSPARRPEHATQRARAPAALRAHASNTDVLPMPAGPVTNSRRPLPLARALEQFADPREFVLPLKQTARHRNALRGNHRRSSAGPLTAPLSTGRLGLVTGLSACDG